MPEVIRQYHYRRPWLLDLDSPPISHGYRARNKAPSLLHPYTTSLTVPISGSSDLYSETVYVIEAPIILNCSSNHPCSIAHPRRGQLRIGKIRKSGHGR